MSDIPSDPNPAPEALSPEAQAVMRRARRSLGISLGLLLLGLMVVMIVLVYRLSRDDGPPADPYALAEVDVPAGAQVVSAVAADGLVSVTYTVEGRTVLRVFNGADGALVRELALVP
jgi:hypothetical protein